MKQPEKPAVKSADRIPTPEWVLQLMHDSGAEGHSANIYQIKDNTADSVYGFLAGNVGTVHDIQLHTAATHADALELYVRRACRQTPYVALRSIARVWERAERISSLAAARSRVCIGQIKEQMPEHSVVSAAMRGLKDVSESSLESATLLLSYVNNKLHDRVPHSEISVESSGNISIRWLCSNAEVLWEVEPSTLTWPGCRIRVLVLRESGVESKLIFNAYDAVEHLSEQLSDGKHGTLMYDNATPTRKGERITCGPVLSKPEPR